MLLITLVQRDKGLASPMRSVSIHGKTYEVTLTEVMASKKDIPSSFVHIRMASSIGTMASEKDIPSSTTAKDYKSGFNDSPPDGGLFAWLQVLGGWILVMNSR
jgi:hypothetical protein